MTFGLKDRAGCHGTDTSSPKRLHMTTCLWLSEHAARAVQDCLIYINIYVVQLDKAASVPLMVSMMSHTHFGGAMMTVCESESYSHNCRVIIHNAGQSFTRLIKEVLLEEEFTCFISGTITITWDSII